MCGRYRTSEDEGWADLRTTPYLPDLFEVKNPDVRPTEVMPVLVNTRPWTVRRLRWGFVPPWAGRDAKPVINARAESLFTSRYFRDAAMRHRGVVASTGFYEWQKRSDGTKLRHTITRADRTPLLMAAVFCPGHGHALGTYAIVTCDSNDCVRPIHDRMPVVLEEAALDRWLAPEPGEANDFADLLAPAEENVLVVTPEGGPQRRGGGQLALF